MISILLTAVNIIVGNVFFEIFEIEFFFGGVLMSLCGWFAVLDKNTKMSFHVVFRYMLILLQFSMFLMFVYGIIYASNVPGAIIRAEVSADKVFYLVKFSHVMFGITALLTFFGGVIHVIKSQTIVLVNTPLDWSEVK